MTQGDRRKEQRDIEDRARAAQPEEHTDPPTAEPWISVEDWARDQAPIHGYEITHAFIKLYPEGSAPRSTLDQKFGEFRSRPV